MGKIVVRKSLLNGNVTCPPSKSYTHRAIFISSLANGNSHIINPLISRDTIATIDACRELGVGIKITDKGLIVSGKDTLKVPDNVINVENSGTTMRFVTAISSLLNDGHVVITGDDSIRKRPMQPLLSALKQLGVNSFSTRENGKAPIIVQGGGIDGDKITIDGSISSQFISGILIAGVCAKSGISLSVRGKQVSKSYTESTLNVISKFGARVKHSRDYRKFNIFNNRYVPTTFTVPGDFSTASLLLSAGTLVGGEITVSNLDFSLPQGDSKILEILKKIGAVISIDKRNGTVKTKGIQELDGGEFDLSDTPDLFPVVAILSLKTRNPVRIYGVSHTRYKETDRLKIIASEFRKFGVKTKILPDEITIVSPKKLKSALIDSHNDHRLFMSFAIAAMMTAKSVVDGVQSVDVSYPSFIQDMKKIGAKFSQS
ncbi:MAG TPA: 3-phosphoshikimate 1-carboxyvinyltransferase [Nitrososphaeraceae archaeon]|nr:3-phosphoshikimate 1-carboxyvinyltransferase [Nitrososphaeraceae archaeon]